MFLLVKSTLLLQRWPLWSLSPRFIRLLILSFVFVAALVIACNVSSLTLIARPTSFTAPSASVFNAMVTFIAEVVSVDPISRTITMNWYPQLPQHQSCSSGPVVFVADIYLDPSLGINSAVLPPYPPVYRWNWTCSSDLESSNNAVFTTVTRLFASEVLVLGGPASAKADLQKYPFDVYVAPLMFYALNPNNGQYISLNVTGSFGNAINFQVTLERSLIFGDENLERPWLYIVLKVDRTNATRIFVILVGITNWLITLSFLIITASTFLYPKHKIYGEMFVLPTATLFAFTSIRANLPGAPTGFGADIGKFDIVRGRAWEAYKNGTPDLFTILPVLIIMSLCSGVLLMKILHQRIKEIMPQENPSFKESSSGREGSIWQPYKIYEMSS